MSDEANPNPDPPHATTAAPATQPAAHGTPAITPEIQALIDQRVAEAAQQAKNATWAEARRTFEGKQKQAGQSQQPPRADNPQHPPATDVRAEVARIRSFERAASRYGLSEAAVEILEADFNATNPPDPAAWVSQRAEAFGWKAGGGTSTPAPSASPAVAPAATPAAPPQAMPAGAPPSRVITQDTRLVDMTPSERDAYVGRNGATAFWNKLRSELSSDTRRYALRPK